MISLNRISIVVRDDNRGLFGDAYSSSSPATPTFWSLREDVTELWIVLVFIDVVDADVSVVVDELALCHLAFYSI
jgi:hypothetical protein